MLALTIDAYFRYMMRWWRTTRTRIQPLNFLLLIQIIRALWWFATIKMASYIWRLGSKSCVVKVICISVRLGFVVGLWRKWLIQRVEKTQTAPRWHQRNLKRWKRRDKRALMLKSQYVAATNSMTGQTSVNCEWCPLVHNWNTVGTCLTWTLGEGDGYCFILAVERGDFHWERSNRIFRV